MYRGEKGGGPPNLHVSDRAYFIGSAILLAIVIFGLVFVTSTLMESEWTTYDMQRFYAMAQVIVDGATPYLDYQDPKPPLIFFTLAVPTLLGQKLLGGLILVGISNFASALLLMAMARRLYGRFSGLLAGLLFTLNVAWAQGYFVLTEPFALTFILLSTYALMFTENRWKYLLAGLSAGVGIGFKQYALFLIPLLLFFMYRRGELKKAPELLVGILIPLAIIFGAIFLAYGPTAGAASLYWSYGVAGTYLSESNMGDVTSYRATDPIILAANIIMAVTVFTSLLLFAAASVVRDGHLSPLEEYFVLASLLFAGTILIRQYLHYWILALPFLALLSTRPFRGP
ncbi:glycosyltransferase family 39 protein [Methanocella conradii]|uniref:glycosyltransferase family 39 protein n=1 Tax=Methanocella conradii TaxID=1175444 RepID=UPI0024B39B78|nr:glycosyltransferase family 39 protein [Methanocella conradii]MDI6897987.1 glycosyltransferase family 39 protein [Methanocella conradii]